MQVVGGQTTPQFTYSGDTPHEEAFHSDVWRSADGASWERVCTAAPWGPRGMIGGSGAVKDGWLWLFSGGTYETPSKDRRRFCNDVCPPLPRGSPGGASHCPAAYVRLTVCAQFA